jgi:hypothetical protein
MLPKHLSLHRAGKASAMWQVRAFSSAFSYVALPPSVGSTSCFTSAGCRQDLTAKTRLDGVDPVGGHALVRWGAEDGTRGAVFREELGAEAARELAHVLHNCQQDAVWEAVVLPAANKGGLSATLQQNLLRYAGLWSKL